MQKHIVSSIALLFLLLFSAAFTTARADAAEEISWDKSEEAEVVEGNNKYFVYFSSDGQYSWIYKVKQIKEKTMEELELPEVVSGAALKKIGYENKEDADDQANLMGVTVEPYHNVDGYNKIPEGIRSISIPSTVTEICDSAFCGFRDLESITIPDGVQSLNYALFFYCTSLKEVVLPKELNQIENDVFKKCSSLKAFFISDDSENYCCVDGILLSKDKKSFVMAPTGRKNLAIPSTVTEIKSGAFLNTKVKKLSIPASVTSIQKGGLQGKKLSDITISSKNKIYGKAENCIYKKKNGELVAIISTDGKVTLPKQIRILTNNVSTVGKSITTLVIPKTVKKLKKNCFHGGISMGVNAAVYFEASTPPKMAKGSFGFWVTYFVPEKSLKKYKNYYHKVEKPEEGEEYTNFVGY